MEHQKQKLIPLTEERIKSLSTLKRLAREGRLFVVSLPASTPLSAEQCQEAILDYVSAIDDCAADDYRLHIKTLWQRIVSNGALLKLLAMQQGRDEGQPNKYLITSIVEILLNHGIYRQDLKVIDLHRRLEHTSGRNRYYMSKDKYCLDHDPKMLLRKIVQEFKKENKE